MAAGSSHHAPRCPPMPSSGSGRGVLYGISQCESPNPFSGGKRLCTAAPRDESDRRTRNRWRRTCWHRWNFFVVVVEVVVVILARVLLIAIIGDV